jgi:Transposase
MSDTELLHEVKLEPVRRLEAFTGAGRGRSWTAEQKARIVAESHADGVTVSAVAPTRADTTAVIRVAAAARGWPGRGGVRAGGGGDEGHGARAAGGDRSGGVAAP